jgi:hypothetical protein
LLKGWDNLAEYAFDKANILPKPNRPNIPEEVLFALDAAEDRHLIPEFKRDMQDYRNSVKSIVQLWKEKGLLKIRNQVVCRSPKQTL